MSVNQAGVDLVKKFEGCRLESYPDPGTGGAPWTVGWGHTVGVNPGMRITQEQADAFLMHDLDMVSRHVEAYAPAANENEHAALVAFAYNVGVAALIRSKLLALFLAGDVETAADQFLRWDIGGGKHLPGLTARRQAERELFLAPVEATEDMICS